MVGIVAGTAVAQADVQESIGAEGQMPAIVIRKWLFDESPGPSSCRSNREDESAIVGMDERLKRATTVSPDVFVKFT